MATMTVLHFDRVEDARQVAKALKETLEADSISIWDAAVISWPLGCFCPKTKHLHSLGRAGALHGVFWQQLFGVLFAVRLVGISTREAIGAIGDSLVEMGMEGHSIEQVSREITEGTSALFLLTSDVVAERIHEMIQLGEIKPKTLTNLRARQPNFLRESTVG
jgi:uncharacterized membrane protein